MNDTVHSAVHRSVHLCGERKLLGAQRLRIARWLILDAAKHPAGLERPHFVATGTVAVAPAQELFRTPHRDEDPRCLDTTRTQKPNESKAPSEPTRTAQER
jgi:hypothetical protein